jgi:hypothetical protein
MSPLPLAGEGKFLKGKFRLGSFSKFGEGNSRGKVSKIPDNKKPASAGFLLLFEY